MDDGPSFVAQRLSKDVEPSVAVNLSVALVAGHCARRLAAVDAALPATVDIIAFRKCIELARRTRRASGATRAPPDRRTLQSVPPYQAPPSARQAASVVVPAHPSNWQHAPVSAGPESTPLRINENDCAPPTNVPAWDIRTVYVPAGGDWT